jgi:DNA-binding FadR family transcriptional regulator
MRGHEPATAFSRRGLHGRLVDALGSRIVGGEIQPGETIDGEAIEAEFEVSRTVVREALKVLSAKGLIDARPRLGTFVRDRAYWNLLDADIMAWRGRAENPDSRLVLELGEVRAIIEPGAAALAASRRSDEQLGRIRAALEAMEQSAGTSLAGTIDADVEFHLGILDAAGNERMERFEVMMVPALRARNSVAMRYQHGKEFLLQHRKVFEAIERSDPGAAESEMRSLMAAATEDVEQALGMAVRG